MKRPDVSSEAHGDRRTLLLPFDPSDTEVVISQGWNGPWSHKEGYPSEHCSLLYAVDFAVPYGTIVTATRAGIVRVIMTESDRCITHMHPTPMEAGSSANFMVLEAEDGTYDMYVHLARNGHLVSRNKAVVAGQPLALTGASGWIGNVPHLHYHAQPTLLDMKSMPIAFKEHERSLWHEDITDEHR